MDFALDSLNKGREMWHSRLFRIINSTICFVLAYILVVYLYNLATGATAKAFGISNTVKIYEVYFNASNNWKKSNIAIIFLMGPLSVFVLGMIGMYAYYLTKNLDRIFKLFFVWLYICSISVVVAQAFIGAIGLENINSKFYTHLAPIYAWWYIHQVMAWLLVLPAVGVLVFLTYGYLTPIMTMA